MPFEAYVYPIIFLAVFLAKLLFPTEAKVAMDIAQVEDTSELQLSPTFKLTQRNQSAAMDLNDAPFKLKEEHLARLRALSKTGTFHMVFCISFLLLKLSCASSMDNLIPLLFNLKYCLHNVCF